MRNQLWVTGLTLVLVLTLAPHAAAATPISRKPLPTKKQWYSQVSKKMKPAFPYLKKRARSGDSNLAINLDIDNVSLATFYDRKAPIPDTLRLARLANRRGVKVFFNSGRHSAKLAEAIPRLEKAGFKAAGYCGREDNEPLRVSKQRCRQKFVDMGYRIIINVGNNRTDFVGTNYEKAIALPNYRGRLS
jgi:hypothetical protein